jgi:peroxiredoxin
MRGLILASLMLMGCSRAVPATTSPSTISVADPALSSDLLGTSPPPWITEAWVNSQPIALSDLHGKVVLVRWFMGTSCPMCSASAPMLNKLHEELGPRGLVVVGLYHHKDDAPLTEATYAEYIRSFGFAFPVARDPEWKTLHKWWLDGHERDFTSVSFLLDKQGRVRGIHPGGRLDYEPMRRGIVKLLAEPPTPST